MRKSSAVSLAFISLALIVFAGLALLPAAPAGAATTVMISGFSFQPVTVTVPAGSTVTWANQDSTMHSVTSDTGAFDSGNGLCPPASCLAQGATFSHQFTAAGTYKYHCNIHSSMHGTVVVTGPTPTTPPPTAPPATPKPSSPSPPPPPSPSSPTMAAASPTTASPTTAPPTTVTAATGATATTDTTSTTLGALTQAAPASHHRGSNAGPIIGLVALVALLGAGAMTFTRWRTSRG